MRRLGLPEVRISTSKIRHNLSANVRALFRERKRSHGRVLRRVDAVGAERFPAAGRFSGAGEALKRGGRSGGGGGGAVWHGGGAEGGSPERVRPVDCEGRCRGSGMVGGVRCGLPFLWRAQGPGATERVGDDGRAGASRGSDGFFRGRAAGRCSGGGAGATASARTAVRSGGSHCEKPRLKPG